MELPNANLAEVSRDKVIGYLLNPGHPDGAGKAAFFLALGYCAERWEELADALKSLAQRAPVRQSIESDHGAKYIVEGEMRALDGRSAFVRTIWIVDRDCEAPRLVTAYPVRQETS